MIHCTQIRCTSITVKASYQTKATCIIRYKLDFVYDYKVVHQEKFQNKIEFVLVEIII